MKTSVEKGLVSHSSITVAPQELTAVMYNRKNGENPEEQEEKEFRRLEKTIAFSLLVKNNFTHVWKQLY